MARAFPERPDCPDVPSIEAIEGSLTDPSQTVDDPPAPVCEFPFFDFPPPDPPNNDFGCFEFGFNANFGESSDPLFEATMEYPNSAETGKCEPYFNFNVGIPPCPTNTFLNKNAQIADGLLEPSLDFEIGRKAGEPCSFELDFDLQIPSLCADLDLQTASAAIDDTLSEPSLDFRFEKRGAAPCAWDIHFDLKLPPLGSTCEARAATTESIALSGTQTIDGVSMAVDEIVLVKNQSDARDNGVYRVKDSAWTRTCTLKGGTLASVREGSVNGGTIWMLTTNDPINLGVTSLIFMLAGGSQCCCYARVATLEDITLSGTQTIDSVSLSEGDIVLVKNQSNDTENGPYVVASGDWERTCDVKSGHTVSVREGKYQLQTVWMLVTDGTIELGTTSLAYRQVVDRPVARVASGVHDNRSGLEVVDGVSVSVDDVVLLMNQNNPAQNGLYLAKSGSWVRTGDLTPGMIVAVQEGSVFGGQPIILSTSGPIVVDTTSLTFTPLRLIVKAAVALDKGPYGSPGQALSGTPTVDGESTAAGDVVLVFNSSTVSQNGVYVVPGTGAWDKVVPVDSNSLGMVVAVRAGARFGQTSFMITGSTNNYIIGMTGLVGPYA